MPKVQEAQSLLRALGLPAAQQVEAAAYTLLALAGLEEATLWELSQRRLLRIHDVTEFINSHYGQTYAENTRESFRKNVLRQFVQGAVADKNADDPSRKTNSGKTCYSLTEEALTVVRAWGRPDFAAQAAAFVAAKGSLATRYASARKRHQIALTLPSGETLEFSPGGHNQLQVEIINFFWPNFVPEAKLLYVGDTANKSLYVQEARLQEIGFPFTKEGKYPDVVLHLERKGWLVLVEAVTSHGPVSPERRIEFQGMLKDCRLHPVYVTAFLTWKDFKKDLTKLAWDTEVWLAEVPDHMIHYNGPKFLGVQSANPTA
jgi:hypothetical protein